MSDGETIALKEHFSIMLEERSRQYFAAVAHLEAVVKTLEKYVEQEFLWLERSTSTTASVMEKRLEGMNEFRDALKDVTARLATRVELEETRKGIATLFTRTEHEAFMKSVDADIRSLRESRAELKGMASQGEVAEVRQENRRSTTIAFILGTIGAICGIASLIREFMKW